MLATGLCLFTLLSLPLVVRDFWIFEEHTCSKVTGLLTLDITVERYYVAENLTFFSKFSFQTGFVEGALLVKMPLPFR